MLLYHHHDYLHVFKHSNRSTKRLEMVDLMHFEGSHVIDYIVRYTYLGRHN